MDIQSKIIGEIRRNRISTTEVADCLGKTGALPGLVSLNRGHFRVGEVFWAYAYNGSNWECHEQLADVDEGKIVLVEPIDCQQRAIFGELLSKYLILYRQAAAIVVQGYLRDAPHLIKENWPIWLEGVTPIGCVNVKNDPPLAEASIRERREHYQGAIAVCDDSGVVIIPKSVQDGEFLEKLRFIEEQEDLWFDCIDHRKWSTFETVCLKRYKEGGE